MSPIRSLFAIWLASCTAVAAFHRRGSANDTAPYTNITLSTSLTSVASTVSLPVVSTFSSASLSIETVVVVVVSSSENVDARPSLAGPTQTPELDLQANVTSTVPYPTANSTAPSTVPDQTTNSTISILDSGNNATSLEPTRVSNASCTINIPSASIDYWYPATHSHAVGTVASIAGNFSNMESYTLVPATATFDAASALESNYQCTPSYKTVNPTWTNTWCDQYFDMPTAATTSLAYRTGFAPFPTGGVIAISDIMEYDIWVDLPLATHTITLAPNRTLEQVSATPYVQFTAYEIDFGNRTSTVQLSSALAYPYEANDVQHEASATGPLPKEFMEGISHPDCDAGQLMATVTVLIVVDLYYENNPMLDPQGIRFEQTALGFDDPVTINDDGRGTPITMADWDLPGDSPKATPAPSPTNNGANPTTRAGGNTNNNNNNAQQGVGSNQGQVPDPAQPTEVTVGNIGTVPVIVKPSSVVVVGSQTLQPGGPAVVVNGVTPVRLVPSATAIVVGGSATLQLPQISNDPVPPPVLTIGSSTLTPNAATQFFIAPGQTLTPGGTATIAGTLISLAPSASFIVVGGSTQLLPAAPGAGTFTNPPQIVVGGATFTALPAQGNSNNNQNGVQNNAAQGPIFVVEGQTLAPGGQAITVGGNTISLVPGGSSVVVNGVTSAVANPPSQISQPRIVVGNGVFTAAPGGNSFVIGDQTLSAGGQAITVSGTVVSLAPSASFVVINGITSAFANAAAARVTNAPTITIGNEVIRPLPGSGLSYVIGSSTLTPGGVITISSTTISLAPGATAIVINGQTTLLTPSAQATITNAPVLTVGSSTITAISGTTYIIGGQTLTPGGTITVDGTTIVLAPGATQLMYGSSGRSTTTALFPATTTRSQTISGASSATAQASGTNGQATATSRPTGSASTSRVDSSLLFLFLAILGLSLC